MKQKNARNLILLCLVLLVAFILRLYHLGFQSLSYDEAVSAYLTRLDIVNILRWTASDIQPPLYYLLLKLWVLFAGQTEFSLRFLSLLFSVLTVALFCRLGAELLGRRTGLLAALVAALHPWYLWHAQDARMYSLLLLLSVLSTIYLLRWLRSEQGSPALLLAGLACTYCAAVYTHYLTATVIVYHLLLVAWASYEEHSSYRIIAYLKRAAIPAAILYLPWLPAVLTTYTDDTSYYAGPVKMNEALRKAFIAIFVGGPGETVVEMDGLHLAAVVAIMLVFAIIVAFVVRSSARKPLLFACGLLLVPLATAIILLCVVPKFNVRYLMPASTGMVLLWAASLNSLLELRLSWFRVVAITWATVLVTVSIRVIAGIYGDQRLTRSDFRSAAALIKQELGPQEKVLLVSGHIYPIWDYYSGSMPYIPLPNIRILSVNSRISFDDLDSLYQELSGASGVWILEWQNEITDPMGIVSYALGQEAKAVEEHYFWGGVAVKHFRFDTHAELQAPEIPRKGLCDFSHLLRLENVRQDNMEGISLFWTSATDLGRDYRVHLRVETPGGHLLLEQQLSPGGNNYPTSLWEAGELTFTTIQFAPPPGTIGGEYDLRISVYDGQTGEPLTLLDQAGNPQGRLCLAGSVELPGLSQTRDVSSAVTAQGLKNVGAGWNYVELIGAKECDSRPLPPGAPLTQKLLWHTKTGEMPVSVSVTLHTDNYARSFVIPLSPTFSPTGWNPGDIALTWLDFLIPADAPGGEIALALAPVTRKGGSEAPINLCRFVVKDVTRQFALVNIPDVATDVSYNELIALRGIDLPVDPVRTGDVVPIVLYWQAIHPPPENYQVFVHLVGPDGHIWGNHSGEPLNGDRPTGGWLPGEVITERITIRIDEAAPSGSYYVAVGMFDATTASMPRLEAKSDHLQVTNNAAIVGELQVTR